jgi:membrane-bound metal-dependent hydrolase YbcI (DUF457 family)
MANFLTSMVGYFLHLFGDATLRNRVRVLLPLPELNYDISA